MRGGCNDRLGRMLLDFLFPSTCVGCGKRGTYFCEACVSGFPTVRAICPHCRDGSIGGATHSRCKRPLGIDGLVSVFPYRGAVKGAVKRLKYRFVRDMVEQFVELALLRVDSSFSGFLRDSQLPFYLVHCEGI